ncbi:hypothetical protein L195_g048013, partial [Trifolium pratense]
VLSAYYMSMTATYNLKIWIRSSFTSVYETSSARYILQQYIAYAKGKVRLIVSEFETAKKVPCNRNSSKAAESDAGCNGKLVRQHTPWLGAHTAKEHVRPLRRALQDLDPRTTPSMFINARCIGEEKINEEDCFILKLCADPSTLKARSEGPAENIRHVLFG